MREALAELVDAVCREHEPTVCPSNCGCESPCIDAAVARAARVLAAVPAAREPEPVTCEECGRTKAEHIDHPFVCNGFRAARVEGSRTEPKEDDRA